MDKRHNVKLTTSNSFELDPQEIKQIYITLSLLHHRYMRIPNYPERPLIEALEKDFKRFYQEMVIQTNQEPNNLTLSRLKAFFEIHCKFLKGFILDYKEQE
ncbi:MAG: hypothetical protein SNJ33_03365 [Rikenellaceae bacterium]